MSVDADTSSSVPSSTVTAKTKSKTGARFLGGYEEVCAPTARYTCMCMYCMHTAHTLPGIGGQRTIVCARFHQPGQRAKAAGALRPAACALLHVHCPYTRCTAPPPQVHLQRASVHCRSTAGHIHGRCTACARHVHGRCTVRALHVHGMSTACALAGRTGPPPVLGARLPARPDPRATQLLDMRAGRGDWPREAAPRQSHRRAHGSVVQTRRHGTLAVLARLRLEAPHACLRTAALWAHEQIYG